MSENSVQPLPTPSSREAAKSTIEFLEKSVLVLLAISYTAGLIVVNIHLNRYGVPASFNLFRLNYLTAGFWALVPILLSSVAYSFIESLFPGFFRLREGTEEYFLSKRAMLDRLAREEESNDRLTAKMILGCGVMSLRVISLPLLMCVLAFLVAQRLGFSLTPEWFLVGILPIWGIHLILDRTQHAKREATLPKLIIPKGIKAPRTFAVMLSHNLRRTTMVALNTVVYLYMFANGMYGDIPAYIGGGKPNRIWLILKAEEPTKQLLQEAGLRFVKDTNRTEDVGLLYATEGEYIVLVTRGNTENALTVPRDLIQAVVYQSVPIERETRSHSEPITPLKPAH